ncbi:MAG: hypothetical protein WDW36_006481 [Sanguina aurantia]
MSATPPGRPGILYALVARGGNVLAEHSVVGGNANVIAVRLLEKLPEEDTRVSYTQDRMMFHVAVVDGVAYMCMAEESFGRRIPFAFLEDIKAKFSSLYGEAALLAVAYEYNSEFSRVLQERMTYYSSDPAADTINRVKGEILEVKGIMINNIEKVLDRGERLDVLLDKTEGLQDVAFTFRREARRLKQSMWWQNTRLWIGLAAALTALAYFIAAVTCGIALNKC